MVRVNQTNFEINTEKTFVLNGIEVYASICKKSVVRKNDFDVNNNMAIIFAVKYFKKFIK